jgi:hypothetical protein
VIFVGIKIHEEIYGKKIGFLFGIIHEKPHLRLDCTLRSLPFEVAFLMAKPEGMTVIGGNTARARSP